MGATWTQRQVPSPLSPPAHRLREHPVVREIHRLVVRAQLLGHDVPRALPVAVLPRPDGISEELLDDKPLHGFPGALGHLRREDAQLRARRVGRQGRGEGGRGQRRVHRRHAEAWERVLRRLGKVREERLVDAGELRGA